MRRWVRFAVLLGPVALLLVAWARAQTPEPQAFHFAILGDRTGEATPGVYERVWREVEAEHPAFVVSVGDTIQGLRDASVTVEWQNAERIFAPYRDPIYLAPGNHDIWSPASEQAFRDHAGHPPHYSFDYGQAHFTILDNSRSQQFSAQEMKFLDQDLEAHKSQPVKFIIAHRPSWILDVISGNSKSQFHQLARKYGVQYVVSGHLHQMLQVDFDGVTYISMESSGGQLRGSGKYEDGWFFGHTRVDVNGTSIHLRVEEAAAPFGMARISSPDQWGIAGLTSPARSLSRP